MSDQPTGEWTAESVMKMFGWRYKRRAEVVANAHKAALAAEQELRLDKEAVIEGLYDQLAAEQEKVQTLVQLLGECRMKLDWSVCDGAFVQCIDDEIAKVGK